MRDNLTSLTMPCWIHAERVINRLIPLNSNQAIAVEEIRGKIWAIYSRVYADIPHPPKAIYDLKFRYS